MKHYILKKELPTFKVGEKFELSRSGNLIQRNKGDFGDLVVYHRETLKKFPNILGEWFEEVPDQPKTVWDLKDGDICWMLDMDLEPMEIMWRGTPYDKRLRELGKIYLTKEELEKDNAWEEAYQILRQDTKGFQPDWTGEDTKYEVCYDFDRKKLCTWCYSFVCAHQDLWFATREDAEASIKAHEKEWKTYLGVEE